MPRAEGQIMEMNERGQMARIDGKPARAVRKGRKEHKGRQGRKIRRDRESRKGINPNENAQGRNAHAPVRSGSLKILTLNGEHLMSAAVAERWLAWCAQQGWRDDEGTRRPEGLPWCEALNGKDARGRQMSAPVRTMKDQAAKVRQLAGLIGQADPDIVLMQEVSDADAVSQLLGSGWHIHSTAEQWSQGGMISQNLAVAWRKKRFARAPTIEVVETLSQRGEDGRLTRPGLALHLEPRPGLRLAILNVHLKAGCRLGRLERDTSRQPGRQARRQAACSILQAQVPALEDWLDTQIAAGRQVVLGGDFNRTLRDEIRQALPARADGTDAASPATTPDTIARISSILPELDDDQPRGARFLLVKHGNYRRHADCHRHIDLFVLSQGLLAHQQQPAEALRVDVIPFDGPVSLAAPRPSDHCPHQLTLRWR